MVKKRNSSQEIISVSGIRSFEGKSEWIVWSIIIFNDNDDYRCDDNSDCCPENDSHDHQRGKEDDINTSTSTA